MFRRRSYVTRYLPRIDNPCRVRVYRGRMDRDFRKKVRLTALKVEQDPEILVEARENCFEYETGQDKMVRVPPSLVLDAGEPETEEACSVPPAASASSIASRISVSM